MRWAGGDAGGAPVPAAELQAYVAAVEQLRLPVNQLLAEADPILTGRADHTMTPTAAAAAMDALERRFATYATDINALVPSNGVLARLNQPYAATYLMEDSYLSALAADVQDGRYDGLPATQNQQRLAIVTWRVQLEVLARHVGVSLPADIEQAGRGEIAPSPEGS
jgi:hypothetical protein